MLNVKGQLWTVLRDQTKKISPTAKMLNIPKNGKYNIYSVYTGLITRDCTLHLGKFRINLGNYNAMVEPGKKYEIKASIKAAKDGAVFIDRLFILENK